MSAAVEVRLALARRLKAHAGVQTAIGGTPQAGHIFHGEADVRVSRYIVLGPVNERPEGRSVPFGRHGHEGVERFSAWVDGADALPALEVYHQVKAALTGHRLVLNGHEQVLGKVRLVNVQTDPDKAKTQAIIEYRIHTRVTG